MNILLVGDDWCIKSGFLPNIKYFNKEIGMQFNNTSLVIEQNNYTSKIINVFIVYDLDNCPNNLLRNFTLKSCLFGATNVVKTNDKEKYIVVAE